MLYSVGQLVTRSALQVSVSVKRLREFLKGEELDPDNTDWRDTPPMGECDHTSSSRVQPCLYALTYYCVIVYYYLTPAGRDDDSVTVIDGSFTWESPDRPSLEK